MNTIQYIDKERCELLEDLHAIIRLYQSMKDDNPLEFRRTVIREMRDYLSRIKQHPTFGEFCELTHLHQDVFINDILQKAIESV